MMVRSIIFSLCLAILSGHVWASFPQLAIVLPRGVQRGGERELVFQGARLGDAVEILFHSSDRFEVRKLEVVNENTLKVILLVPDNCALGEHIVQVRTKSGISDYRSFMVGALKIVDEKEPNGSLANAQAIELNSTLHGIVENEDVDHFAIDAKMGQRISVDIEAMRLGSYLFDPYIAILDEKRFELAATDDAPIAQQDGVLSILAPADGKYYVQVRETSYAGDGNCRYRLHIGNFPRPTAVFPAGGKAGEQLKVNFLRDAAGDISQQFTVAPAGSLMSLFPSDDKGVCPSAIPMRISDMANALEQEPNNDFTTATATDVTLSFNGIIQSIGDVDCFKFAAKKDQVFDFECYARRVRSGLDPVVNLYYADGRGITGNDDARGPDSYFRFQVPQDGEYIVRVADHLGRGQSDFVYRIEAQPLKASLTLSIPRVDRYSQTRQTIFVPQGNRFATLINANRVNFGGELVLEANQLPAGITLTADPMPANLSSMPVVFEAGPDAPLAGKLMSLEARHTDEKTGIRGRFENNADLVLGPPNNAVFYSGRVDKLAVAVIEALPFHIDIVQPQAPLVRNGTMNLRIVVRRAAEFNEPITVEFPFRPPGIGAGSTIQIPAGQSEAIYQLNADGGAAIGKWPIYVIGQTNVKGAPAWASSQMARLEVAEPYTSATLARASCEQGQTAQVVCTLTSVRPFEGQATARLVGLPPNTTSTELKFTNDSKELVFDVVTNAQSPVGKHKTPFIELLTTVNQEQVLMRGAATELQIDAPLVKAPPPPVAQAVAASPPAAPAAEPPKERPLTRLEKLRMQAKQ